MTKAADFFDRSAYSRMMDDVENGKIGVCIMKDLTRWGRDYLQVGNAMEIFRRNNVRFIAVNNGIDSEKPDTLEFAPFINIMSEWYAKDISKKVKTGIKTKGMSGKPIVTEAPYGYVKDPDNKDFWIIDEGAAYGRTDPPTVSSQPGGTGRPLLRSCFSITATQKHSATSCSNWYLPTAHVYPRLTVKSRKKTEILR